MTTKGDVIDDGEIWVNLKDHTIDLKRIQRDGDHQMNNHVATYNPPDTLDIVKL